MAKKITNEQTLYVTDLKCEYINNPLGIESQKPRFSWLLKSQEKGITQKAYQILVASSKNKLKDLQGDIWDSGKIISNNSTSIKYKGEKLKSAQRYYWQVRVWDNRDNVSDYSEAAYWEMGLAAKDWQSEWIGKGKQGVSSWAPFLRKEFSLEQKIKKARVYISGLGYYELYLNGKKVGDHVLDPGQTNYEKRVFYLSYDVTERLKTNKNVLGIILGDGWYNQNRVWGGKCCYGEPRVLLQLNIEYEDGSTTSIVTDDSWKINNSPITLNNIYGGETYDARLEQLGWNDLAFDDSTWHRAQIMEEPGGKLVPQLIPPIRKTKLIETVDIKKIREGVYVFDLGQNFAGWVRLTVKGLKGTEVVMRFAEEIDENGMIDTDSSGVKHTHVIQTDRYILKGEGVEVWEPRFTYHGFRYVELVGFPGVPSKNTLLGILVHTDVKETGSFACSDKMINKIHETYKWTQLSNLHSIPEDCPVRERCGWLGDAQVTTESTIYNWDMYQFWYKYLEDIRTTKEIHGTWHMIAPGKRTCGQAAPAWGTAQVQIPWYLYLYYGDKDILEEYYQLMKEWLKHLLAKSKDYIVKQGLGDWCPPGSIAPEETPVPLSSTGYFYYDTIIMAKTANILDKTDDKKYFNKLASKIKKAFNQEFLDKVNKTYGSQTANCFALYLGLSPKGDEEKIVGTLVKDIKEKNNHFSTGIIGNKYLYGILTDYGYGNLAQTILNQKDYPGFGYLFSQGATTLWETWEKHKSDPRSRSHPMHGGLDSYFYSHLAGIKVDEKNPGFKNIILKPNIFASISWVNAHYNSIYGKIESCWQINDNLLNMKISVPANTSATLYIPSSNKEEIKVNEKEINDIKEFKFITINKEYAVYKVLSGEYDICSPWEK